MNECMKNLEFKNYLLLYIDILGSKERILLCEAKNTLNQTYSLFNKALQMKISKIHLEKELTGEDKTFNKILSDNILIGVREPENCFYQSLLFLMEIASFMQTEALAKNKMLLRGSISYGDLCVKRNKKDKPDELVDMVWGEALRRAYEIENEIAIYPRIILDIDSFPLEYRNGQDLKITGEDSNKIKNYKKQDNDGFQYLDYYRCYLHNIKPENPIRVDDLCASIDEGIKNNSSKLRVLQKYYWTKEYLDSVKEVYANSVKSVNIHGSSFSKGKERGLKKFFCGAKEQD